jgi:hypothetical protein
MVWAVLCLPGVFTANAAQSIQVVRETSVTAESYRDAGPTGVKVLALRRGVSESEHLAAMRLSEPVEARSQSTEFRAILPERDNALDAEKLLEFMPPLGKAESLQRIAGDRWIMTLADGLVKAEARDGSAVLRFPLANFLSTGRDSTTVLVDSRLAYDRATHRWALSGLANPGAESSGLLVAVSETADPTGQWLISELQPGTGSPYWVESPAVGLSGGMLTVANSSFSVKESAMLRPMTTNAPNISISLTPSTGTGANLPNGGLFELQIYDSAGAADITSASILVNTTLDGRHACYIEFTPSGSSGAVSLVNDNSTAASPAPASNSQCTLTSGYFFSETGERFGEAYLTFNPAFVGTKAIYASAAGTLAGSTGFVVEGAWDFPTSNLPPEISSVSPSSGRNTTQTFTVTVTDPNGGTDLAGGNASASLLINSTLNGASACFINYVSASQTIELLNDAGNAWILGTIGTGGILQNSQCSVSPAGSSYSASSTGGASLNVSVTFKPAFAGVKTIFASATDAENAGSGWQQNGFWIVSTTHQGPNNLSVSPSSGLGVSSQFSFTAGDAQGGSDLATMQVLISNTLNGTNACYFVYTVATNTVSLLNNAGTSTTSAPPGSATVLSNSQCSLNLAGAFASPGSSGLTLSGVSISFVTPGFVDAKDVWINATDLENATSGWVVVGSWGIPSSLTPPFSITSFTQSGTGQATTFNMGFTDVNGASRITQASLLLNSSLNGVSACFVTYFPANNTFGLLNDASSALTTVVAGTNTTTQNSQCVLNGSGSSATLSANTLNVNYSVTFLSPAFSGTKNVYVLAQDTNGLTSNWSTPLGYTSGESPLTWTVP